MCIDRQSRAEKAPCAAGGAYNSDGKSVAILNLICQSLEESILHLNTWYLSRWLDGTSAQPSIFKQELLPLPQKPARGKWDEQLITIEILKDASNVWTGPYSIVYVVLCMCYVVL